MCLVCGIWSVVKVYCLYDFCMLLSLCFCASLKPNFSNTTNVEGKKLQQKLLEDTHKMLVDALDKSMRLMASCEAARASDDEAKAKTAELKTMQEDMVNLITAGKKSLKKVRGWLEGLGVTTA